MKNILLLVFVSFSFACGESKFQGDKLASVNKQETPPTSEKKKSENITSNQNDKFVNDNDEQFGDFSIPDSETGTQSETNVCFDPGNTPLSTSIKINGENWPGNSIDPGGADFNDYYVTISGEFNVMNTWELFSAVDQEITVQYSLGSPGSTTQVVKLQIVNCEKVEQGSFVVSQGSGTQTLSAKAGDRFNIYTTANTSGTIRYFDLLKDKNTAFRID